MNVKWTKKVLGDKDTQNKKKKIIYESKFFQPFFLFLIVHKINFGGFSLQILRKLYFEVASGKWIWIKVIFLNGPRLFAQQRRNHKIVVF